MLTRWTLCALIVVIEMIRRYSELSKLKTFDERFEYLKLDGKVGSDTFGFDRWINQQFYRNDIWKSIRRQVIIRDEGCDLGVPGYEIERGIIVHHMNPITTNDLKENADLLTNPEFLICVSLKTHNAIHYGDRSLLEGRKLVERRKGDTCPWKAS